MRDAAEAREVAIIREILAVSEGVTPKEYEAGVDALDALSARLAQAEQALTYYAREETWTEPASTIYEEAEPWSVARAALASEGREP